MFKPKIIAFYCKWCTSAAADLAGTSRMHYAPNVMGIRVMCSGRVDSEHIMNAFKEGADGVLVGGCHPGDCHYKTGNYQTLKRIMLLKMMVRELGINEKRIRLEWISASEGKRFKIVVNEFTEEVRKLGKLKSKPF